MTYENRAKTFRELLKDRLSKVNLNDNPTKFKIIIEEHISQEFEVEAKDMEEAMRIAEQKYCDGEFVVDAFNAPTARLMYAENKETGESTEWEEF